MRYQRFEDPEAAQDVVKAFSSDALRIRPAPAARDDFRLEMGLVPLPEVSLFKIRASTLQVTHPDSNQYYGATLSLGTPFRADRQGFGAHQGHVMWANREFELIAEPLECLVIIVPVSRMRSQLRGLDQAPGEAVEHTKVDLDGVSGGALSRFSRFLYSEACRDSAIFTSSGAAIELEDALVALLAQSMSGMDPEGARGGGHRELDRACEFALAHLENPITRERLAEVAGVSIRTLSRLFQTRHNTGPMGWIRRERLHRARAELQLGDGETSVTQVSLKYGFENPSTFARLYRAEFGELPSHALVRPR